MFGFDITAIILTFNEEKHISRCIESIRDVVTDVVVVDSYSSDNTVKIAGELGAKVLQNPWKNYATQFQWGLENAEIKSSWVMRIDADEYIEAGNSQLEKLSQLSDSITGVYIDRKYFFMNKWMRFGAMHPISHLRIWRSGMGRIEDRWMDEHIVLKEGAAIHLDIKIVDDNRNNLSWWISKHNSYATREVIDNLNLKYNFLDVDHAIQKSGGKQAIYKRFMKENLYTRLPLFVRPFIYFFYRYFIRLGFLDGVKGFIFHFLQAFWYRMLVDFKQYEAQGWLCGETRPEEVKRILIKHTGLDI